MRLLLASKSETRRRMLEAAGVEFQPIAAEFDEEVAKAAFEGRGAAAVADGLAELKALSAAAAEGVLVLGADQTLEREDGGLLSKPASRAEAAEQLRSLAGRSHWLHSAAAIVESGRRVWGETESVKLTMRPLGEAFLDDYLDREYDAIRWSVGGYRIEGPGAQLFDRIEGSHFAILGLPLLPLLGYLRQRGLLAC